MKKICKCRVLLEAAEDPLWPIGFDEGVNEYYIHIGYPPKHARAAIYYCWFCGGKITGSTRNNLFHEMDPEEKRNALDIASNCQNVESILESLGMPDELYTNDEDSIDWIRTFVYRKRWKTLILSFFENENKKISSSLAQKHKSIK